VVGKEDGMAASGIQIIVKIKDLRSWFGVDFDVLLQSNMAGYLGKDDWCSYPLTQKN
jgi:hypothetical protein